MTQSAVSGAIRWISRHFLAIALAMVWFAAAILQRYETPALGAQIASLLLAPALAVWAFSRGHFAKKPIAFMALASLPVIHLLGSSLLADDPRAALLGTPPHWDGWLLWAGALTWFLLVIIGAERHDLADISRVFAVAGGVSAAWAIAEVVGILRPYDTFTGLGMAMFDNAISLGQALLVTLAGTLALAVRRNITRSARLGYGALALLQVTALVFIEARGALLGLAMGVVAFAVTETGSTRWKRATFYAGATAAVLFVISLAVVSAAWSGVLGGAAYQRTNELLTNRLDIWTDVAKSTAQGRIAGIGASQFDTIVNWEALPDGRITEWFTYSEHGLLFLWLLGTGVLGLFVFGLVATLVSLRFLRIARAPSASAPLRVLVSGGVATFVAMLTAWPDPLTLLSVSVLAGGLIGTSELASTPAGWTFSSRRRLIAIPAASVLAATVFALYALSPQASSQYQIASVRSHHPGDHRALANEFRTSYAKTGDPFYVEEMLLLGVLDPVASFTSAEVVGLTRELASNYPRAAEGRADIPALALELLWTHRAGIDPNDLWTLSEFFAGKGAEANPTMSIWPYARARAAVFASRSERDQLIDEALSMTPPPGAESVLRQWMAEAN